MNPTVILSIFNKYETYMFSLSAPTESLLHSQEAIYGPLCVGGIRELDSPLREQLNGAITDVVREQRRGYAGARKGGRKRNRRVPALERLGQLLFNMLLPPTLQDALRALPDQQPIMLTTTDIEIPWELLHDGEQFLALKHPFSRRLWSSASVRANEQSSDDQSLLFISNPTGDLEEADSETELLMDLFEPESDDDPYPRFLGNKGATRWQVLEALGMGYEIIHYSGHAEPGKLLLADGEMTTEEIQNALQGHPFVFLNACYSAKEMASQELDESGMVPYAGLTARNLAQAFIMGGAAGFMGTLWPVFDQSSREFAEWFYTRLRKGMAVGEALRQTRQQMYEERPGDPIWASFVLYGDPMLKVISAPAESQTRHISVLVARVEGLLPLFDALNLEEAAQIRDQAIHLLRQVAQSTHGHFYAPMSDMLMVHFGVPKAYGNDTEQAIEAALRMSRTLHLFDQQEEKGLPARLGLKVGISTGSVLVRPVSASNGADYEIVGQVEGIATTLAAHAEVNQVLVDHNSEQVARDKFAFDALPPLAMGAGRRPITRYRVVDQIGRSHPPVTAIVGREDELNELRKQWRKVKRGKGLVVGIEGEAGVGKTRLVTAFYEQIAEYNPQSISAICHTYEEKQSYSLLAQVIRQLAGIEGHDHQSNQRHKIGQLVLDVLSESAQSTEGVLEDRVVLLSRVVGLPFAASAVDNLQPAQRQKILERVVVDILKSQAASVPIVLVLEDLQWADEASLAVLDQVIRQVRRIPLLLLAVYRSDWEWPHKNGRRRSFQYLSLEELEEDERGTLLEHLLGTVPSEELEQLILTQTGGNPLFVKEYVRLLQENGSLIRSGDAWVQAADLSQIPDFGQIEQVIQARLDQLTNSSREAIEKGAVIGVTFEEDVLKEIQDLIANQTLEEDIEALTERRLIDELGGDPYSYAFYHGLVRDSAYKQQPERSRRAAHGRVANALRDLYGDQTDIYRLGHHYYHSNDRLHAIDYCLRVAKQDADKWANQTAVEWYDRALEKIESFEQTPPSQREEQQGVRSAKIIEWQVNALEGKADVQVIIGQTDEAIGGYTQALEVLTTSEVLPVTHHADLYRKVAIAYHDKGQFDPALNALNKGFGVLDGLVCLEAGRLHVYTGLIHWKRGRFTDGLASCEQGIAIIKNTDNIRDLAQAYNLQGILYRRLKDRSKAMEAYKQSIALYEQAQYIPGLQRASYSRACLYKDSGEWKEALDSFQKCTSWSNQTGEVVRQVAALNGEAEIYLRQGQLDLAITTYAKTQNMAQEFGFEEFEGVALMNLGASCLKKGQLTKAREHLKKSLDIFQRRSANQRFPELLPHLAELEILSQQPTKALQYAQEAVDWVLKLEYKQKKGQAKRSLGQAYRALGKLEEAARHLDESLKILEERDIPYEVGLTLLELALLSKAQIDVSTDRDTLRAQAIAHCDRAIAIFNKLGAALDLEQAQQIRQSL
ncbi:MAG: CHAT domain-containing protein [Ardenticatenaceae bacterium]